MRHACRSCPGRQGYPGGYCGGVPPLPIPNREVKPACADGTAMQCGRVGGRHFCFPTGRVLLPARQGDPSIFFIYKSSVYKTYRERYTFSHTGISMHLVVNRSINYWRTIGIFSIAALCEGLYTCHAHNQCEQNCNFNCFHCVVFYVALQHHEGICLEAGH